LEYQGRQKNNIYTITKTAILVQNDTSAFTQFIKNGHVITEMYENPAFNHK